MALQLIFLALRYWCCVKVRAKQAAARDMDMDEENVPAELASGGAAKKRRRADDEDEDDGFYAQAAAAAQNKKAARKDKCVTPQCWTTLSLRQSNGSAWHLMIIHPLCWVLLCWSTA